MSDTSKAENKLHAASARETSTPEAFSAGNQKHFGLRRPLVIGNWKMNGDVAANERLLEGLRSGLGGAVLDAVDVAVCPPFPFISQAAAGLRSTAAAWGAQDVAGSDNGAFTGEVSARMLADVGCTWVLVGHSERRQLFGETDDMVALKVKQALAQSLRPVVCLGETLQERQSEVTEAVLAGQLDAVIPALASGARNGAMDYALAYEPVWAIGTGLTATPAQAQAVHAFLRSRLAQAGLADANKVRILYGGSMKAANAIDLLEQDDVDGGLIGGASLVAQDFVAICKAAVVAASKKARPAPGESLDG
jgi:triosephosphate isomerase